MDEKKDFFHIANMTARFREETQRTGNVEGEHSEQWFALWDLRCKLAIAQQLSVISRHLAKIVDKADGDNG